MKKRIYRIVKEKCGIPQVGARWALAVTMIAAALTVGVALAQRRPAMFEPPEGDERMAAEQRERQVLAERRGDLENRAHELKARFDQVRMELAELEESGKDEGEKAGALRGELRDLEAAMARLERELHELEGERRERGIRPLPDRAPRQEILRRLEELGHETEMVLQRLAEQNFGRNDETNMLYGRMRELNEQMQQVRQQLGRQLEGPGRQRREFRREGPSEGMIQQVDELRGRARQIELELKELGGENPERAEKLHVELREIHEAISQIERDVSMSRARGDIPRMPLRKLREHARGLEFRLKEIGDLNPEEAQEIQMQLDQIHRQIQEIEHEPGTPERAWPRDEDRMQRGAEFRRQELMVQREQLRAQLRDTELALGELNEQGKAESEQAHEHRIQLDVLQQQLREIENEFRRSKPGMVQEPGREDLEREVQNLRKQMDGMNEQMGEMRELMKRLLEKNETPEAP